MVTHTETETRRGKNDEKEEETYRTRERGAMERPTQIMNTQFPKKCFILPWATLKVQIISLGLPWQSSV